MNASKNMLNGLQVRRAMRKRVNVLAQQVSISVGITTLIKYKINALLVQDEGRPVGVVSKTDIMGSYYAGLDSESPLEYIMSGPPLFCMPEDPLEMALEKMRSRGIYRLYVQEKPEGAVVGILAYPDIVGLLYSYCANCEYSHFNRKRGDALQGNVRRTRVSEFMSCTVKSVRKADTLLDVMEELSAYRMGALLVVDRLNLPVGVVSKTDLILAYKRGLDPQSSCSQIMSSPVRCCSENDLLEDAIRTMIYGDVHRLCVKNTSEDSIVGVFSLSDAARSRSGSCHGCISSRICPE